MKIRSLTLKGFGKFDRGFALSFDSPSNINIVVGRNESGKSTIANSLFGVLFGFPNGADHDKYQPWKGDDYWGSIELSNGVEEYRVERDFSTHLVKVFRTDRLGTEPTLVFEGNVSPRGKVTDDKEKYNGLLQEFFGFSDPTIFRSTLFLNQNEISTLGDDETAGRIRQYISGSLETDYEQVLSSLREQYFELTKSNPWGRDMIKNRRLEEIELRMQELKDRLSRAQDALEKRKHIEQEKDQLANELKVARDEWERADTVITKVMEYRALQASVRDLKESYAEYEEDLNTVVPMSRKLAQLDDEYAEVKALENLPEEFPAIATELESLAGEMKDTRERLAEEQKKLDQHPRRHITFISTIALSSLAIVFVLSFLVGNVTIAVLINAAALVATSSTIAWAVWKKSVSNELRQQIGGRIEVLNEDLESKRSRHRELESGIAAAMPDGKIGDLDRLRKKYTLFLKLAQQRREISMLLSKLPDEDSLTRRFDRVRAELNAKTEQLDRARANASYVESLTPEEEELYRKKIDTLDVQGRDLETKLKVVEQEYWSMGVSDDNINVIEDELEDLEEERVHLRRRADAIYTAITVLINAQSKYQGSYMERFCDAISDRFRRITGERYHSVDLSEDSMVPVVSNEANEKIPVAMLSAGAQDQLYFSMRLAMVRYLTTNRDLPIIIDDSFVTFDAGRLARTRAILEDIAQDNQIIFFTHDRRYLDWQVPAYDFENADV